MLIVMQQGVTEDEVAAVVERGRAMGLRAHPIPGAQRTAIGITGNKGPLDPAGLREPAGSARGRSRSRSPTSWSRAR